MIMYIFNNSPSLGGSDWASVHVLSRRSDQTVGFSAQTGGWPALAASAFAEDCLIDALAHGWVQYEDFGPHPMKLTRLRDPQ